MSLQKLSHENLKEWRIVNYLGTCRSSKISMIGLHIICFFKLKIDYVKYFNTHYFRMRISSTLYEVHTLNSVAKEGIYGHSKLQMLPGVTGCIIPRHRLYPGLNRARLDYTRVYYVLGQFIPRGMNWPRPVQVPQAILYSLWVWTGLGHNIPGV